MVVVVVIVIVIVLGQVMAGRVGGIGKGLALGFGRTDTAEGLVMRRRGLAPHQRAGSGGLHRDGRQLASSSTHDERSSHSR